MKKLLIIITVLFIANLNAQEILIQNGSITTCSGIFLDSGGLSGNYSNNENYIFTICPENSDQKLRVTFNQFSTQTNADILSIYDGNSTEANLIGEYSSNLNNSWFVLASEANESGCLTFQFVSNESASTSGWSADVSCVTPCQEITAQLDSVAPEANTDGIVQVCVGQQITLNGSGVFENDGTGATYQWDLGNGDMVDGQNITYSYNTSGVYVVNLNINDTNTSALPLGCNNNNRIDQIIQVAAEPDFTGTAAADETLCFGEETTIAGIVNAVPTTYNCPPPISNLTFLPDGSGVSYSSCVTVDCFTSAYTLTDISQIESICMNIEHSYLGDLEIKIISPNGQEAILKSYPGGGGFYLGGANDDGTNDPGVGADYCFSMAASTLLVNGETITAGTNPPYLSIESGLYLPEESFQSLLGSPLNGDWCIEITDNLAVDNGYIFSWELNFDPTIPLDVFSFETTITSQSWDADSSITEENDNVITVSPNASGEHCYTYRVTDNFGCEYTEEVCITVADEAQQAIMYFIDSDNDGYGDANNSIQECIANAPQGYVDNNLDCDDSDSSVNPDAEDAVGDSIDQNCDGVDGTLSVEQFSLNNISITPNPFKEAIVVEIPSVLLSKKIGVKIFDLNGREVFSSKINSSERKVILSELDKLKSSTYFLKMLSEDGKLSLVKKLVKI